jgi:hypothetical protein
MNRYPLRLSALAIGVAMVVGTYSLVRPPAPRVAAQPAPTGQPTTLTTPPPSGPVPTPTPTYAPPPVPTGQPAGLSLAQVYQRVQQAISRPRLLYHATIQTTARLGQGRNIVTQVGPPLRQWVDARHDVAREEQNGSARLSIPPQATLLTAQRNYHRDETKPDGQAEISGPSTCAGATVATSAVLGATFIGCPQPGTVVQRGRYAGRPAIVLVRGTATETWLLYLDARTFLPLAGEITGLLSEVTPPQPLQERMVFTHAFIPVHAVPAHFFDPATFFRPEAPLNRAPRGFTIGWLGAHFAGRRHLPPLVLSQVEVAQAPACSTAPTAGCVLRKGKLPTQPRPEFILEYPSADAVSGPALVTLIETRATWNSRSRPFGPCVARQNITLPRERASIFMGWDSNGALHLRPPCPTRPFDRFFAYVLLGQTVIHVDAPGAQAGSRTITSPYNTRQAIEVIVRALRPRVPTHGTTGSNK